MTDIPRLSARRIQVLSRFVERPATELSGADIMRLTGLASGSLYPILYALEDAGLLDSRWETEDPEALGRPKKRLYWVTALGQRAVANEAAEIAKLLPAFPTPNDK